jgi:methyl-accepting chemotaxis protein
LRQRGEVLQTAYEQAKEADRVKTAFLHNMTNQMLPPVNAIGQSVSALCDNYGDMEREEADRLVADILHQGTTIADLLDNLLNSSEHDKR